VEATQENVDGQKANDMPQGSERSVGGRKETRQASAEASERVADEAMGQRDDPGDRERGKRWTRSESTWRRRRLPV